MLSSRKIIAPTAFFARNSTRRGRTALLAITVTALLQPLHILKPMSHFSHTRIMREKERPIHNESDVDASELSPLILGTVATRLLATSWEI